MLICLLAHEDIYLKLGYGLWFFYLYFDVGIAVPILPSPDCCPIIGEVNA